MNYSLVARQSGHNILVFLVLLLSGLFSLAFVESAHAITASPQSVQVPVGASATVRVRETQGTVTVSSSAQNIATVTYAAGTATIHGIAPGTATITIRVLFWQYEQYPACGASISFSDPNV